MSADMVLIKMCIRDSAHTHTPHIHSFRCYHNVHLISYNILRRFTLCMGEQQFPHVTLHGNLHSLTCQSFARIRTRMYGQLLLIPCLLTSTALLNETNNNVLFVLLSCVSNIDSTLLQTHCAYINQFMTN